MGLLHVDVHAGNGPPVLLVHGLLSSRSNWLPNLDALSAAATPVVVELLGHGRSPAPSAADAYAPDAYVEEFERVRDDIGAPRWFVCGHSLGAALTLRYALAHPDRVLAHVLTNSNSALAAEDWRARVGPFLAADADAIERGGAEAIAAHPLNPGRGRRLPADVRDALVADCALHDPLGLANTLRHTVPASPVRDRVAANRRPALLVVGEREDGFAPARAYAEATMPHLRVVADRQAGHAVNIEASGVFNDAVVAFFTAHRDG